MPPATQSAGAEARHGAKAPRSTDESGRFLFDELTEVALQQALESLAVTGRTPWDQSHGGPFDLICSGGVNPPGIEVLPQANRSVTRPATAQKRPDPLDRGAFCLMN